MLQQITTWLLFLSQQQGFQTVSSQSLLTFELFSVMVHSGSAAGGHYYACIKSFSDGQWYSFNDQHVSKVSPKVVYFVLLEHLNVRQNDSTDFISAGHQFCTLLIITMIVRIDLLSVSLHFCWQITQDDIRKTYGGSSGSRGYYSSAFARSVGSHVSY